ncbi:MAG: hypothetical protein IPJ01_11940 [Micavibrio sp.]|nr:hypothetical protein [Micavibrio sp.]
MNSNAKGAIAVGITLGVVGLAYYFLVYKKDDKGDVYSDFDNFNSLQTNLGLKANKDDVVVAPFNEKNNSVQFYKNNRAIFFDKNNKVVVKGSYSNGGQSITLDNGKEFSSGSVWQNIRDVINKK